MRAAGRTARRLKISKGKTIMNYAAMAKAAKIDAARINDAMIDADIADMRKRHARAARLIRGVAVELARTSESKNFTAKQIKEDATTIVCVAGHYLSARVCGQSGESHISHINDAARPYGASFEADPCGARAGFLIWGPSAGPNRLEIRRPDLFIKDSRRSVSRDHG